MSSCMIYWKSGKIALQGVPLKKKYGSIIFFNVVKSIFYFHYYQKILRRKT